MSRFHLKRSFLGLEGLVSEQKFKAASEEVTSHLSQTCPDRSQPWSDVVPTGRPSDAIAEDGSWCL